MELIDFERLDILRELAEDDPTFLNTVIDAFLPQLTNITGDLRNAFERRDADELARHAHSLKGSASNLGAEAVRALCLDIEHSARTGTLDGLGSTIDQLTQACADTAIYFSGQRTEEPDGLK